MTQSGRCLSGMDGKLPVADLCIPVESLLLLTAIALLALSLRRSVLRFGAVLATYFFLQAVRSWQPDMQGIHKGAHATASS